MGWEQKSPASPELGIKNAERLFLKHVLPVKVVKRTIGCCWRCWLVITRHKKYKIVRLQGSNTRESHLLSQFLLSFKIVNYVHICVPVYGYDI